MKTNSNQQPLSTNKLDWENWLWHIDNAIQNVDELKKHLPFNETEYTSLQKDGKIFVTPYMLNLLKNDKESGPLRRQFLPYVNKKNDIRFLSDFLNEESAFKAPNLIHKYKNRAALLVTNTCANYCQFCTRQRIVKKNIGKCKMNDIKKALKFIKDNDAINEVLVTGGEPLLLKTDELAELLDALNKIKHVKVIRIGTRMPITLPMRINENLVSVLSKYSPLYINIHINHVSEITEQSERAVKFLANAGIPLGSQSVLLSNINDNVGTLKELFEKLLQIKVKPYYLFQCEEEKGCENFFVPVSKGIKLINELCGLTSGLAIPRYAVDTPSNFSKLILAPYMGNDSLVL